MLNNLSARAYFPLTRSGKQLRQYLLWLLLIRIVFFTLLIGVTAGLEYLGSPILLPSPTVTLAFLAIIYIFSIGSAALLFRGGVRLQRFGLFQLFTDTLFAALLVYGTGCSQSIFTPVFILPVIAGGMIMYQTGGIMAAAAATIFYGLVLFLEYTGNIPGYLYITESPPQLDIQKTTGIFAVYGITFFLIALLSGAFAGRLKTTEQTLDRTTLDYDRLSMLYKQIFDDINTGIITMDNKGHISSYNTSASRITGFSAEEVIGLPLHNFFPCLTLENMSIRQAVDLKRKNGSMTRVGYSFSQLNPAPHADIDRQNYSSSKLITMQDISNTEEIERRMRKAEKMAAIGELSTSIAHDFRNPLAAICGSAQLLVLEADKEKSTSKILNDIILREGNRMARTISDFLQFSQTAPPQNEWFNLYRLINEIIAPRDPVDDKAVTATKSVQLDFPETFAGFGDRQQIQTVITHLIKNAVTATKTKGTQKNGQVIIRAGETDKNEEEDMFYIEVIDQGKGIEPENMENIFKPFFSTIENRTGLGLAIVQQIIDRHNGRIEVKSKLGHGCSIRVILPLPDSSGTHQLI